MLFIAYIISIGVVSQNMTETLYGFRLGQYYKCLDNSFDKPYKIIENDDITYKAYLLEKDMSSYIIFGVFDKKIVSIQLFSLSKLIQPKFRNLKMGMSREKVLSIIGHPDLITKNDIGGELFNYKNSNFSIEINKNVLSSIKIFYNPNLYKDAEIEQLPRVEELRSIILKNDNNKIEKLLSPTIECWGDDGKVVYMGYSWDKEILYDYSNVFQFIKDFFHKTENLKYEREIRLISNYKPMFVYKFKSTSKTIELVFKNEYGKYLLWEVKYYNK